MYQVLTTKPEMRIRYRVLGLNCVIQYVGEEQCDTVLGTVTELRHKVNKRGAVLHRTRYYG
jgi:hypothetical protein